MKKDILTAIIVGLFGVAAVVAFVMSYPNLFVIWVIVLRNCLTIVASEDSINKLKGIL